MVYRSLSACLMAIRRGTITTADVSYVIASTQIPNRELVSVYCASLCLDPEPCLELWDTGRIYQATKRVDRPAHLEGL